MERVRKRVRNLAQTRKGYAPGTGGFAPVAGWTPVYDAAGRNDGRLDETRSVVRRIILRVDPLHSHRVQLTNLDQQ